MRLEIIIASTRPGRIGDQIGKWIAEYAVKHSDFEVGILDLAEINLPFIDEPLPPAMNQYANEHTKEWAKLVGRADAFIVVTPEYNYTMPPSLLNAVDYLNREWKRKPVGFVGYGVTGAIRSIQTAKVLFANLNVMPIPYIVPLAGVHRPVTEVYEAIEQHEKDAKRMLDEVYVWAEALKELREKYPLA